MEMNTLVNLKNLSEENNLSNFKVVVHCVDVAQFESSLYAKCITSNLLQVEIGCQRNSQRDAN